MTKAIRRTMIFMGLICFLAAALGGICVRAEEPAPLTAIPRIDSSTARIPITGAVYALLKDKYQLSGPEPMCSKTHGAWLNLADGEADILFTVAPTEDEFRYFQDKGVGIEMKVYGYDGLVFIGNGENPVQNLSGAQIRAIYRGEITNWSALGGGDAPIDVYIRNRESGSQRLFEQLVWAGYDMPDFSKLGFHEGEIESVASAYQMTLYEGMEGIVEGVALNKYAIGFNIMSYVDDKFLNPPDIYGDGSEWIARATGEVNLRGGPGLAYKSLGTIPKGAELSYLDADEIDERGVVWYKVSHESKGEVWISSRYSELEPVVASQIKLFEVDGFAPVTEHFASGDYPFVTTSIAAIRADEPEGSPARQLFDWIGTEESRVLIAENSTLAVSFSPPFEYTGGAHTDLLTLANDAEKPVLTLRRQANFTEPDARTGTVIELYSDKSLMIYALGMLDDPDEPVLMHAGSVTEEDYRAVERILNEGGFLRLSERIKTGASDGNAVMLSASTTRGEHTVSADSPDDTPFGNIVQGIEALLGTHENTSGE